MNSQNLFEVAEVQLTYKNHKDLFKRPQLGTVESTANLIKGLEDMKRNIDYKELFYAIYLNPSSRILSVCKVAEGTTKNCQINIRQIIQGALLQNATGLIVCHNHPSGDVIPSRQDMACVQGIKDAAKLFEIELIDSLVISSYDSYSFLENGLL